MSLGVCESGAQSLGVQRQSPGYLPELFHGRCVAWVVSISSGIEAQTWSQTATECMHAQRVVLALESVVVAWARSGHCGPLGHGTQWFRRVPGYG